MIRIKSWWDDSNIYVTSDDGDIHIRCVNDEISTGIFIDYNEAERLANEILKMIKKGK